MVGVNDGVEAADVGGARVVDGGGPCKAVLLVIA